MMQTGSKLENRRHGNDRLGTKLAPSICASLDAEAGGNSPFRKKTPCNMVNDVVLMLIHSVLAEFLLSTSAM